MVLYLVKFLFVIFVVAVVLRFYRIDSIPPSLTWDEAAWGYNAYSLLITGRDEHSHAWPINLESFGDFKPAGYAYILIPFIKVPNFWIWAGILFATRVGAATIEIMSESYFFKSVDKEDANIISFFRNTAPLSFIIAPLLATLIFLLTKNFSYIFFILGAILLCGLFVTLQLRDVK